MKKRGGKREIKVAKEDFKADWRAQKPLLVSLALAFAWQEKLDAGEFDNMNALAKHLKVDFSYLSRILNLTLLDPFIVEEIVNGREPSGTSLARLQKGLPLNWDEQRRKYGFEPRQYATEKAPVVTDPKADAANRDNVAANLSSTSSSPVLKPKTNRHVAKGSGSMSLFNES